MKDSDSSLWQYMYEFRDNQQHFSVNCRPTGVGWLKSMNLHIRLLCLAADAGYIKFKIKQNTQIALRVSKIITKSLSSEISARKAYKTKDLLNLSIYSFPVAMSSYILEIRSTLLYIALQQPVFRFC